MTQVSAHVSSHALRQRIQQALDAALPYEAVHLGVAVTDGTVTLTGTVLTRAEHAAVLDATLAAGARAIADQVTIEGDDLHPTDSKIATAVRRALHHTPTVSSDAIIPIVTNGHVVLTGEVVSAQQRSAAVVVTGHVHGVESVEPQLRVT
jgi:osmotically-inducible protein OsmY